MILNKLLCLREAVNFMPAVKVIRLAKRCYGIYEPDYLELMKPKIPIYDKLNIQIQAYDYKILENYQKFLVKAATNLNINVDDSWPMPVKDFSISRLKKNSSIPDSEYLLKQYERVIHICSVASTVYPILLRIIEASQPEGVTVQICEHESAHEESRYIPDYELNELKKQLEDLESPNTKKK